MPDPNAKQQVDLVDAALARKTTAEILDDKEDKKEVDSEESKRAHAHYMRFTRSLASLELT